METNLFVQTTKLLRENLSGTITYNTLLTAYGISDMRWYRVLAAYREAWLKSSS